MGFGGLKFINNYGDVSVKSYVICVNIETIIIDNHKSVKSGRLSLYEKYFVEEIYKLNKEVYFSINGVLEYAERFISLNECRMHKIKTIIDV